jgi:hypothetical protein
MLSAAHGFSPLKFQYLGGQARSVVHSDDDAVAAALAGRVPCGGLACQRLSLGGPSSLSAAAERIAARWDEAMATALRELTAPSSGTR